MSENELRPLGDFFQDLQTDPGSSREDALDNEPPSDIDGRSEEAPSLDEETIGKSGSESLLEEPGVREAGETSQSPIPPPLDPQETASNEPEDSDDGIGEPDSFSEPAEQRKIETSNLPPEPQDTRAVEPNTGDGQADLGNQNLMEIMTSVGALSTEVRELRKLYHQEFAGRLQNLQREVERNREIESGRIFDGVLGSLARLYHEYELNTEDIEDIKAKKLLGYMLDDVAEILGINNVQIQKSKPGDKRIPRHSQIVDKIPTEDPALHDTVAQSKGTGFHIENRTLIREMVDIYLYTGTSGETPIQN